ncbi:hypothetical protein ACQ4PT_066382 [Festuca glaucescens]
MGQTSSLLVKSTLRNENDRIKYATSSMQGLCSYMEDASAAVLDLDLTGSTSFFGVYDGHGGANVALYCANRFHTELLHDEDYQNNLDDAVGHVFFRMDEQLREDDEWRALAKPRRRFSFNLLNCLKAPACVKGTPYSEGSTASVALIRGNRIIVGNVGDSRCVLSRNGQAMDLSTDHKPNLPDESRRIQNAGGRVTRDRKYFMCAGEKRFQTGSYRVNGDLAMSRSIGDFNFKSNCLRATEQMVTCNPDIRTAVITDDTEFLLIASEGIWDMLSSQGAVNFVHQKLARLSLTYMLCQPTQGTTDLRTICERLLDHCTKKSKNNMTVILVQFKPAARIPLPAPPAAMPVAQSSASETSSGTSREINEDPPASVNNV